MAFQINDQYGIGHNSEKRKITAPNPNKGAGDQFDEARVLISENGKERNEQLSKWLEMLYASNATANEKLVGGLIVGASNSSRRRCFLKIKEIAELLNIGESSVRRAISGLSKNAFIRSTNQRPGEDGTPEKADRKVKWHVPNLELLKAEYQAKNEFKATVYLLTKIVSENGQIPYENLDKITHELALKMSGNDDELTAHFERKLDELMIFLRSNWEGLPLKMSGSTAQNERKNEGESLYMILEGKRREEEVNIVRSNLTDSLEQNKNLKNVEILESENVEILHGQTTTNSEPNISTQRTANSELELSTPKPPPVAPLHSGELPLEDGENFFRQYSFTFPLNDPKKLHNVKIQAKEKGITREQLNEFALKHDTWLAMQPSTHYRRSDPYKSLLKWIMDDKNFRPASNHTAQNGGGQLQAPTDPKEVQKSKIHIHGPIKNSEGKNTFTGIEAHTLIDEYDGLTAEDAMKYLRKSENFDEAKERIFEDRHEAEHGTPKQMLEGDILWKHHTTGDPDKARRIGFYRKSVMDKILEEMPELGNKDGYGFTPMRQIITDFEYQYFHDELHPARLWKLWYEDVNKPQRLFDELFFNFCKERHQETFPENEDCVCEIKSIDDLFAEPKKIDPNETPF